MLECSDIVVVSFAPRKISPMNEQSLDSANALLLDNSMLALQNPFSSLVGLEIAYVTGDPNIGKSFILTPIVDFIIMHI